MAAVAKRFESKGPALVVVVGEGIKVTARGPVLRVGVSRRHFFTAARSH